MKLIAQTLTVHTTDNIATITLNRPQTKNAMNFVMIDELLSVARRLKHNRQIRAVIITGGDNFCSGMDVTELNNPKNLTRLAFDFIKPSPSRFQDVCLVWRELPMPVIALINGVCLGAGLQLALGADFRIATPHSQFGLLEAKWGLVADMGISLTAKFLTPQALKELAMTAKIIDAKRASELDIVTVNDNPTAWATTLITDISSRSPDAVLASKRLINGMTPTSRRELYREKWWQMKLMASHNRKLAIAKAKDASIVFAKRHLD